VPYRGKEAFALRLDPSRDIHRLFVNLDRTLLGEDGQDAIKVVVQRHAPASTSHVLPVGAEDSVALAEKVATEIEQLGLPRPHVLSPSNLRTDSQNRRGVIVVAASVGSGQSFQDASRDLRDTFGNLPRTFMAGLRKHSAGDHQLTLLRDQEHNNDSPKHVMCFVDDMTLPHPNQFAAWTAELRFWNKVMFQIRMADPNNVALNHVGERVAILSKDIGGDYLFLKTGSDSFLKLGRSDDLTI
jgi:hypothetical protein